MNIKIALLFAALLAASQNSPAQSFEDGEYHPHEESGVKLPFDPMFCDSNHNEKVDPDEIREDNVCNFSAPSNQIFAQKPISALGLKKGELALTIDDGPNPSVTPNMLNLFDQYGIKATFFMVGLQVKANQALVREVEKRGHVIANHSYTHCVVGECSPKISAATIVSEVLRGHDALMMALNHEPKGRLLFRAPGLNWNAQKALNLNANGNTRTYIGPIHANLGTDKPRADWACWGNKDVSTETCANYYFEDIVGAGRGIILTHDIYFKAGSNRNSYEMLKILLRRLDQEAGGIKNKNGKGLWSFVGIQNSPALAPYDVGGPQNPDVPVKPTPAPPKTSDGFNIISSFAKDTVNVRSEQIELVGVLNDNSKITVNNINIKTGDIASVADMKEKITVEGKVFRRVRIEKMKSDTLVSLQGMKVYIWDEAF